MASGVNPGRNARALAGGAGGWRIVDSAKIPTRSGALQVPPQ